MARRSDHSREELRAMALRAGREIVLEKGVKHLTTRAVAKRIGYSPGTLYVLFKSADHLKLAINAGTLAELRSRLKEAVAGITDPEERLRAMGRFYLEFGMASPSLWRLMFEHELPGDEPLPEIITHETDALLQETTQALRDFMPELKDDIYQVTAAYWSTLHGLAHLVITNKLGLARVESAHDVLDEQLTLFITGLRKRRA